MAMTLHVDIVSAEKQIFSGTAEMVIATAEEGELGILPRHNQMLARLKPGQVRVKLQYGEEQVFYVSGGMLEVQPHAVTVLADTAERAADLDEAMALESKRRAEEALASRTDEISLARAQAELLEAIAQLQAIEKLRKVRKV